MMIEFSTSPIIAESLGSFENGRVAYDVAGKSHDLYLELTFGTTAYKTFKDPVAVEEIKADGGIDIGGTLTKCVYFEPLHCETDIANVVILRLGEE